MFRDHTRRWALVLAPLALLVIGSGVTVDPALAQPVQATKKSCDKYIISGGPGRNKEIDVDDDLVIELLQKRGATRKLLNDRDGTISNNLVAWEPIEFKADGGDRIKITAYNGEAPFQSLSPLWLHCKGGNRSEELTKGVKKERSSKNPIKNRKPFFEETVRIDL